MHSEWRMVGFKLRWRGEVTTKTPIKNFKIIFVHGYQASKPIVFVGHSLGTRAIQLYLEKNKHRAAAVFLIAAFANRRDNAHKYDGDGYPDFFEHKIDIDSIKNLSEKFVVIHSTDDVLDYEQGQEIVSQLDAELITFQDRGHFSKPENAPILLRVLQAKMNF